MATTIYVNSTWTNEAAFNADLTKPEGLVWGTTAFSNYQSAYNYASVNDSSATISIESTNTLSGNTFDNNHKNKSKLAVVIKDGASLGDALSKWDMTYAVTVEAGGKIEMARPKNSSVSNIHIKNTLTIGEAGEGKKTAYLDLLSDSYQDGDISLRYNGKIVANNAVIDVQDLDAQGKMTLTNTTLNVEGALATTSSAAYKNVFTNCTINVAGTQITGGLSDFSGGDSNQLGLLDIIDTTITFKAGAAVKVAGNVTMTGTSTLDVDALTINSGKLECISTK